MIKDSLERIGLYACISEKISQALDYLTTVDPDDFGVDRVELGSSGMVALHQQYTTGSDADRQYENHTEHIDVQFVVSGTETIRVTDVRDLAVTTAYDPSNDVTLYGLADGTDVRLIAGDFVILFPHDAHIPQLQTVSPADVDKIVVKIRVDHLEAK